MPPINRRQTGAADRYLVSVQSTILKACLEHRSLLPPEQAQAQPRFHHQLLPDNVIYYEAERVPSATADNLRARGWKMQDGLGGGQNIQAVSRASTLCSIGAL
jgi:gamma-glutamyltranspeptidase/glutathione hydrolase